MEVFEKIYVMDPEFISNEIMESMIMCGSSNWNYYFTKTDATHSSVLKNVKLIEFETEKEMLEYMESNTIIDYSIEHQNPCILV